MRASDDDRHRVSEILRVAAGDGRLDLVELEDRLERAYAAKTYADLDEVVADLPADFTRGNSDELVVNAVLNDVRRSGAWVVPRSITAKPLISDIRLDFRKANCRHSIIDIKIVAGVGSVVLIVPEGWAVIVDHVSTTMGTVRNDRPRHADAGKPLVRVTGNVGIGSLRVRDAYFYER